MNASHGLGSDNFTGFGVITILRLKRFRLFLETAVNNNSIKTARYISFLCTGNTLRQEPRVYPTQIMFVDFLQKLKVWIWCLIVMVHNG